MTVISGMKGVVNPMTHPTISLVSADKQSTSCLPRRFETFDSIVEEVKERLSERGFEMQGVGVQMTYTLQVRARVPLERAPEVWSLESDIEDTELVRELSERVGGVIRVEIVY